MQGLRAVAIAMVVVYHIFFERVSGGVDVFLLISAFLLTGSFARRLEAGERLGVRRFWIRSFKRLVPPAVVTILGVLVLMRLFYPAFRWREILTQSLASLFYVENWHLAASAVDYYAADRTLASPLQHFWSLSIQGQVFLVWPLLMLATGLLARRFGWDVRRALAAVFGVVFVLSLGWATWSTTHNQAHAYFDTFTRLWEFALGSLLALGLPLLERRFGFGPTAQHAVGRPPLQRLRVVLGWVGLVGVLSCGFVIDVQGAFPGWVALWPLLSACLVIGAGHTGTPWGVDHWLSSRPLRSLGDMSYALYLVHWPLLITLRVVQDAGSAGLLEGLILLPLALRAGWLLTRYVDAPLRYARSLELLPGRAVLVIVLALIVGTVPVLMTRGAMDDQARRALNASPQDHPGTAALTAATPTQPNPDVPPVPLPQDVPYDWANVDLDCQGRLRPSDPMLATHCGQSATGEPSKVIVVVGNSRAQQYMAAMLPLAAQQGYTVVALLKGGGSLTFDDPWAECVEWNERVLDYLVEVKPRAVLTTTTHIAVKQQERVMPGVGDAIGRLTGAGITVIGLRDQPRMPMDPIACVDERGEEQCTVPVRGMYAEQDVNAALARFERRPGRFHPVDLTPWICPEGQCPPVIGNVFVHLDANHLTQVHARTLAPMLDASLRESGFTW